MTLGVRVIIENDKGQILLVRHTYVSGWHLPGGGVESGDTMETAARKEVSEETGIEIIGPLELCGMYFNRHASPRDHVGVYRSLKWKQESPFSPNREIAEAKFFSRSELPAGTTKGTKLRIQEVYEGISRTEDW